MRWRTRTENLHVLHPVVKLADGTLLVGSQTFSSPQRPMAGSIAYSGNFVVSEVTFDDQRWFQLDPVKVVTMKEVGNPDLSRVDEIGFVDLMPGGGHGVCRMLERLVDRGVRDSTQALGSCRDDHRISLAGSDAMKSRTRVIWLRSEMKS